ncbi:MAG: hypothetical protein II231_05085, partial [Rikenellaceae bacterium]|nr:hypothetical protein [Rikenellaceae bacterium]
MNIKKRPRSELHGRSMCYVGGATEYKYHPAPTPLHGLCHRPAGRPANQIAQLSVVLRLTLLGFGCEHHRHLLAVELGHLLN